MRNIENVFHLAIPCAGLDAAYAFYVDQLGCQLARRYDDRITLNFFGDQVVCHLSPDKIDKKARMYPRHFGVTFYHREDYESVLTRAKDVDMKFFREPFIRFQGQHAEHRTFFLQDPSNNLLEFKHYNDPAMMY